MSYSYNPSKKHGLQTSNVNCDQSGRSGNVSWVLKNYEGVLERVFRYPYHRRTVSFLLRRTLAFYSSVIESAAIDGKTPVSCSRSLYTVSWMRDNITDQCRLPQQSFNTSASPFPHHLIFPCIFSDRHGPLPVTFLAALYKPPIPVNVG